MKIRELTDFEPSIGDIVEFETDPDTVVEGVIVAETEDGYVFEFSSTGLTELVETCTYGKYYCSTDKKYKCRKSPKQSRKVAEGLEYADKISGLVDLPVAISPANPKGTSKVVSTGDRIMVVMNVRGVNVPYYISTGSGGKASVPTGKWYPVFGRHSSGWLNKGGEDSINKFYGSKVLALNASRLNNALGDLSSVEAQIPFMKKTGDAIINKDLQPMGHSEVSANPDEFKKRVNSFLAKLGSEPFYKVNATQPQGVEEAHPNSKMYDKCWDGYKKVPGKKRGEKGSCVKEASGYIPRNSQEAQDPRWSSALTSDVTTHTMRDQIGKFFPTTAPNDGQEQIKEAEYQGRTVPLGKPMKGDVKKSKVYVRNDKGNVVKVNFGDPNMRIKKSSPKHRKSFRARHNCDNPGPRWKARYWSCKAW